MTLVLVVSLAAFAFITWQSVADIRRGSIERGTINLSRAVDPPKFWGHIVLSLLAAIACAGLAWEAWTGASADAGPSAGKALMAAVLLIGFGAHWLSELRKGSATIGTVSFARSDEAREYWLLIGLRTVFLLVLAWNVFLSFQ